MIGVRSPFDDQYDGSRRFVWLADMFGLSVDLINFLICQISALFLASLFRSVLHTSRASVRSRHAFGLGVGLLFGYFFFGRQAIHIVGLPALCYMIMQTQNPRIVQRLVMAVAMAYLSAVHLYRLYYDYGSTTIDITGPLMMITQKVTTLAFSLHDGMHRDASTLSATQRVEAVRRVPSPLEYFAYCLHFQSLMAGPIVLFGEYQAFVDGSNWRRAPNAATGGRAEPSPMRTVVQKMLGSTLCAFVFMKFGQVYPVRSIKDGAFVGAHSSAGKLWYVMNATMFVRFKYYHAWLMGDAICNNSGLGFNGYDARGQAKWDLCSNIDILGFEFATNFRDGINSWNLATNRWLRNVVYDRVPHRYGTILTFGLSALWHGFYPGYYLTFASGALMVMAARVMRKHVRHHFQSSSSSRQMYDVLTVLLTRVFMAYTTFPFVILEFKASLNVFLSVYMCLHLIAALTIVAVPLLLPANLIAGKKHRPADLSTSLCDAASKSAQTIDRDSAKTPIERHVKATESTIFTNHCDSRNTNNSSPPKKLRQRQRVVVNVDGEFGGNGEAVAGTIGEKFDSRHRLDIEHIDRQQQQRARHFVAGNGTGAFMSTNLSNAQF